MSQIVIPCFIWRSFDCEGVIAENVSVNGDFLFDRYLTEWPRTGNETGKETGKETEVIQIVIQMIQKWSLGQVIGQVAGQVMRLSEVMSEVCLKLRD